MKGVSPSASELDPSSIVFISTSRPELDARQHQRPELAVPSTQFNRPINVITTGTMSKKILEFPDVSNKLQAPSKKSLFERQKADAEAKRLREEAETAAVYQDFVKSFDDEDLPSANGFLGGRDERIGAPGGRHFSRGGGRGFGRGGLGLGSGPGSLGPVSGGPKKRAYDGGYAQERRDGSRMMAFDDYETPSKVLKMDHDEESREEERAVPKPTIRLASLPPGTSPAVIKALIPSSLTVDSVRITPSSGPVVFSERKSSSAIVTLAKDTAANDIDAAVSALQNRYLGFGYYLTLHRHLSSAAVATSSIPSLSNTSTLQPFGAKPVAVTPAGRGQGPPHRGNFAPPSSYGPSAPSWSSSVPLSVPVQAPQDIKELKLIHKTIESLLTHGPEFEALLMSRPSVQREERWAWLWDSRSTGGVWYRWRLWETLTGTQTRRGQGKYLPLFEGSSAWKQPDRPLAYEYTTKLEEFVSDSEYNSSDDEESGDEGARKPGAQDATVIDDGKAYLNPFEKAKLTHLLARLPTSTGKLRRGDVARVTAFAISHAGRGSDEVVASIIANVEKPFAYTSANPSRLQNQPASGDDEDEEEDTSSASLIGLYIVSDILSSSSTSGVRHAWRYRSLFENELKKRKTFEGLGKMERKMKWGRLRAEKWKRSVGSLLGLWEGWCVFAQEGQEGFAKSFNEPGGDEEAVEKEEVRDKGKWKSVKVEARESVEVDAGKGAEEDVDGDPMDEDEEDVDGVPMEDSDDDGEPIQEDEAPVVQQEEKVEVEVEAKTKTKAEEGLVQKRRRPRAVDMFADSDDSS